jgi:KDO2-lipid IV(A) lauroyltransferase
MTATTMPSETKQLSPRYWGTWISIGLAHLVARIPLRLQYILGRRFGRLLLSNKKLSHIARTNISRCFPDMNEDQLEILMQKYFINQGIDLLETLTIWCRNGFKLVGDHVEVDGLDNLRQALKQDKGIILLSSHFGNVDMGAMLMAYIGKKYDLYDFAATFREQPNPVLNRFMTAGRAQYFKALIPVNNIRRVSQELKNKKIVWYAPDMDVAKKNAIFIPFLGVQASTTTAISRLAKLSDSIVVPYAHYRIPGKHQYRVTIFPPLENFPSTDITADTLKINQFVEQLVTAQPENYWWILRRFKTRPAGEPPFYQ